MTGKLANHGGTTIADHMAIAIERINHAHWFWCDQCGDVVENHEFVQLHRQVDITNQAHYERVVTQRAVCSDCKESTK